MSQHLPLFKTIEPQHQSLHKYDTGYIVPSSPNAEEANMQGWITVHKSYRGIYFEKETIFCFISEGKNPAFSITTVAISKSTLHYEVDIPQDIYDHILYLYAKSETALKMLGNIRGKEKKIVLEQNQESLLQDFETDRIALEKDVIVRMQEIIIRAGGGLH
jgi:hypothetical protein